MPLNRAKAAKAVKPVATAVRRRGTAAASKAKSIISRQGTISIRATGTITTLTIQLSGVSPSKFTGRARGVALSQNVSGDGEYTGQTPPRGDCPFEVDFKSVEAGRVIVNFFDGRAVAFGKYVALLEGMGIGQKMGSKDGNWS